MTSSKYQGVRKQLSACRHWPVLPCSPSIAYHFISAAGRAQCFLSLDVTSQDPKHGSEGHPHSAGLFPRLLGLQCSALSTPIKRLSGAGRGLAMLGVGGIKNQRGQRKVGSLPRLPICTTEGHTPTAECHGSSPRVYQLPLSPSTQHGAINHTFIYPCHSPRKAGKLAPEWPVGLPLSPT